MVAGNLSLTLVYAFVSIALAALSGAIALSQFGLLTALVVYVGVGSSVLLATAVLVSIYRQNGIEAFGPSHRKSIRNGAAS